MIEIKMDAGRAFARFSKAGIPEAVRNNLRRTLPQLTKRLGTEIEAAMDRDLKSHDNLAVTKQMIENPTTISGRVQLVWTGSQAKRMVPVWLEGGTRPHEIVARNAKALSFFWPRVGARVAFKRVMHPGTRPYKLVENAMMRMEPDIVQTLINAVNEGVKK